MSGINEDTLAGNHQPSTAHLDDEQLETLRWKLRKEIINLMGRGEFGSDLQAKKFTYNYIVDAHHERRIHPLMDPMNILPHELVLKIFLEVSHNGNIVEDILLLTMVSTKWRNFILSESLFWNYIVLDNRGDISTIIALQASLSGPIPLTIAVRLPSEQCDIYRPVLFESRDRIQEAISFGFYQEMDEGDSKDMIFWTLLDRLGPLPSLRRIKVFNRYETEPFNAQKFLDTYPSLEQITNIPLTSQDLQRLRLRSSMETLVTFEDARTILPLVESVSGLKEVSFYTPWSQLPQEGNDKGTENEAISGPQLDWTELIYKRYHCPVPLFLLRRLSSLDRLELSIEFVSFSATTAILPQLEKLSTLNLSIYGEIKDAIRESFESLSNLSVHSLKITFEWHLMGRYSSDDIIDTDFREIIHDSTKAITAMLLRILPNVMELTLRLNNYGYPAISFFSLEGLFTGKKLYLYFARDGVQKLEGNLIPPSVHKLSLSTDGDVVCALSSKCVKSLGIYGPFVWSGNEYRHCDSKLNLENWAAVEDIRVYSGLVTWDKSSLQFLRTVSIYEPGEKPRGDNSITSFIHTLACRPDTYPSLENINIPELPELDILMIMLERRNLLQGPGVNRISEISFDSPCSRKIRHIISTMLAGKWVERPDNKDLSLAGNVEILLDLSL
jgi:hypothetical protein